MPSLLDRIPLLQPPPGVKSDFVSPESNAYLVRIPTLVLLPIMAIFTVLRFLGRYFTSRGFGADDCEFPAYVRRDLMNNCAQICVLLRQSSWRAGVAFRCQVCALFLRYLKV